MSDHRELAKRINDEWPPLTVFVARRATYMMKNRPVFSFLWILGLALVGFGVGISNTAEELAEYDRLMALVDRKEVMQATEQQQRAYHAYYQAKGWFSCDSTCQKKKAVFDKADARLQAVKRTEAEKISDAKKQVGVFSTFAVQEVRDLFWGTFEKGKSFAKRQSFWDMIFIGMGRNEGFGEFLVRWLANVVLNILMGLFGALVAFLWYLWDVVKTYQPDPLTAVIAVFAFALSGIAMVGTVAAGVVGGIGAAAYSMGRQAALARLEDGRGGGSAFRDEPRRIRGSGPQTRVRIVNTSKPEYNGQTGIVTGMIGDRVIVKLEDGGNEIKVPQDKVVPVS